MSNPISFKLSGLTRRVLLALSLPMLAGSAFAQAWPSKTIKLIVPFPAGGPTDTASRIIGQKLALRLKQPVIVENKAGASGAIAAAQVAKSPADGYTLMMLATPTLLAPHLYKTTGYDSVKDFTAIATVYDLPIVVVVNPSLMPTVTDLQKLVTHAKAQPGRLNYTSSGVGSFGHLSMELLKQMGQFDMQHVPYRGGVPAITDTLGGQVPMMYADLVAALPHIQSGGLRAIAVGSPQRVGVIPDVKTIAEQGFKGFDAVSWGGLMAPAGTPKDVVDRLSAEVKAILAEKDTQDKLLHAGAIANYQTASQMATRVQQDYTKWGKVIRDKGITNQ
ncbi:tripartite tricarboxylate transporter substrate binding protein [Polaromonas sp.]|uniref:Bug family tripartite tricarboxylate transporter substrate binding protein n=1 Tax=Polaromonas sp. TaxID=1869339 RepID=UPI001DA02F13|nr:tripartite tricarboxylate transporter substrate binding protein [Polaromonas sp.]MBT9477442.1 tripartite tricarboxylate transporter substrate binding protein [Polaromonas sp.]